MQICDRFLRIKKILYISQNRIILIQYTETGNRGKFFIKTDGNDLAEMTYLFPEPGIIIIDHTEVSDTLKGKNVVTG